MAIVDGESSSTTSIVKSMVPHGQDTVLCALMFMQVLYGLVTSPKYYFDVIKFDLKRVRHTEAEAPYY